MKTAGEASLRNFYQGHEMLLNHYYYQELHINYEFIIQKLNSLVNEAEGDELIEHKCKLKQLYYPK